MAKRSNRCLMRYEKDQLGCMWGLISMFDFRHGRSTQRLLSDIRRGYRNAVGVGNSGNKLNSGDNCPGTLDGEEKTTGTDACKPTMKKLLEEEMSGEKVAKKEVNNTEVEAKEFDSGQGDNGRQSRKRRNKTCRKSSGSSLDMDATKTLVSEASCQHKSEQQTTCNLDIDSLMEEVYQKIHQNGISCVNNDQPADGQPNQKSSGFEERLSEAIKFLVSQKLINRNQLTEDGELQASKEVMDALQILSLDEELFSKLLRDPNSLLVKCVQNLPDAQLKDKESKPLAGSNFSEQEPVGSRQSNEPVNRKQRNFFRRKPKTQERDLSDGNKVSQTSNKILTLKPGPTSLQTPETGSSLGASSESQYIIRHREPNEKVGSYFFLAEIKRKLKHAVGREQHGIPTDGISKRFPGERQNSGESGGVKEYIGMNSPTKDHFFIERVATPSIGVKKGEKTSKLKGSEMGTEYETTDFPKQRISNIYIEAKKHLSEMLTIGDENVDLSSRQVSKTLGRILSLPEYNLSPVCSPERNGEPSFITAQMRFADPEKFQKVNENNQHNHVIHLSQVAEKTESQICISDNKTCNEVQGDNAISSNLDTCMNDDKDDLKLCSTKDEISSEGAVSIVKETKMMDQKEIKLLNASSESDSSLTTDDKNVNICEVCDEKQYPQCLKQDSSEEDQQPFSPLASPSNSSVTKNVECLESVADIQERPSPVSVLEPIFADDVISPASIRSHSGETSIQPIRILFEENGSLAINLSNRIKSCMDDKESIFEHIKAVLQASSFNWDELYIRSLSSDLLLNPLLLDEIEYLPNRLCHDQKLLFDCINEVLMEICGYHFGSPGVSFVKPNIRPIPNLKNSIQEVWQGVYWHLLPMTLPWTLDQIVRKDMAKTGTWMDLRLDTDCIGVEMGEAILEDLVEDTIKSYVNESLECEYPVLPA
ncbi:uncharacterized protein LOC111307851 [Durio zibethinus]|uniref:Uncharacterized protein LOC111307851 n=1 Tax=Durio zibethinus TaxID=66656 RepID=A0A6P6AAE0_DURZI|nr:uncharacterized protein LOC111307851 [Durio zibethinus]XP_022761876.1 uncharacterized protein LOC111307851 [Durio zibethinus]XP_022761877.1 uncharacterized protein LOC111307851 [Durio zibethinus]XP_022761879.1 uncharacterized protein LOC111307851 [Durio zibethinus]